MVSTGLDDLESSKPGKFDAINYTKAEFKLNAEELERWFTKIDHIFEHTRIPKIGEILTPFYKISIDREQRHHLPLISHINYKDDGMGLWQVDVDMMDVVFTSLVEYLQLEDAYNIFILNPKSDAKRVKYGYRCQDALNNVERLYQGKDTADIIQSKVLQFLNGKNDDLKLFSEKDLKSGDFSGFHAECLTDTWIGNHRWAFIDLTAGPFSWGPSVGGEGVRTEQSLPNVEKTIGAVAEISEDEAEDRLQEAIQEKFAVFGENDHNAVDILLAEIDIYELFAFKHCKGRKVKLALCEELDERMQDLKKELQSFEGDEYDESHKKKAIDALKRMENWNLFSDTHEDFQNYTVARDTFLSHLGATLWGSLRHIVSPSLADGAFHYYEKISFQLFFITQEKTRHIKQLPLDLKSLMDGLSSLVLPSQKVQFSPHMLPLSEDPALAMAFSAARRAAAVPLLLVNGTYRKTVRSYLDSSILQHQLQRLNDHASLKGSHAHSRSTLEIPIFWFIHGDALLVDKHYQAKALSDMVIVVQSEPSSWESHLQCNGQSLLWDLRRPIKAALAAVSEHLAGLLPLHLVYSQAHETAIEISTVTGELRYADALRLLNTLEDASKGQEDQSQRSTNCSDKLISFEHHNGRRLICLVIGDEDRA
ncbi:hypothetical protein DH2020_039579 [Rehmannia glutinosa]|uniref:DUF7906 domain-containing protein n=1 Tax=Rehmannia glutinosa TaxID=99300 RepID=A0ABR0UVF9_REHGL